MRLWLHGAREGAANERGRRLRRREEIRDYLDKSVLREYLKRDGNGGSLRVTDLGHKE